MTSQSKISVMDKIVSLAKRRGFIVPSSELYGGIAGFWDYLTLGVLMKTNIREAWLRTFVYGREDVELVEGSIIMNSKVWEASGHLKFMTDPLLECKKCHARLRADHLEDGSLIDGKKAKKAMQCPACGGEEFSEPQTFNLMFESTVGPVKDSAHRVYLRPETAQSMFANFKTILESRRKKIPFGIAQIGKAFRNEIATGDFTFRSREFEQAEIEYFVKPGSDEEAFEVWMNAWMEFLVTLGLPREKLRFYEHPKEKLSHYSKRTVDIEYEYPFGWKEIAGIANRTDFDLRSHGENSQEDLRYFDETTKEKYYPYVIEPTLGIDRVFLALLIDAYTEIEGGRTTTTESIKEEEVVLKLDPTISPLKAAVLPLVKNKPDIVAKSREVFELLKKKFVVEYDESGTVGRRYRRHDEIGTPFCITIDFETLTDGAATVRNRDTMTQERVAIRELPSYLAKHLARACPETPYSAPYR